MKSEHFRLSRIFFAAAACVFFLTTCSPISKSSRKSWIDLPFQNASFQAGEPIPLLAHVYAGSGVAEVQCSIDSVPYHRGSPQSPGASFTTYSLDLVINDPGSHLISVVAYDSGGNPSDPSFVEISVAEGAKPEAPAELPTSEPPPEATAALPAEISLSFWADQTQLQQGGCTQLHWNVQHADAISLGGIAISDSGSQQICPTQATTYTLTASSASDQEQQSLTISVASPPPAADQDPPLITNITHSPQKIWNFHTCGPDKFSVNASVSDDSDISSVTFRFRVVKGGQNGSWVERFMSGSGGSYQITVTPGDLQLSMESYKGIVEYTISAQDKFGNSSKSEKRTLEIGECLL